MERLQIPPHDLVIDEARFRALLAGFLASVPSMTQDQFDGIIGILESEKTQIDAVSERGEKIRRLIASLRIMAALDWAEIEYGLPASKP